MVRIANLGIVASVALLSLFAAGCGNSAQPGSLPQRAAVATMARLTIVIPAKSSSAVSRTPKYVSAATQSMMLNVTPQGSSTPVNGFPQTVNLTPTSTGCASTLASTQCSITLALAPGSYDTTVTTYDQTGGDGNVLSAAQSVPFTVTVGQANTIALTLGGIATSVAVVPDAVAFAGNVKFGLVLPPAASGAVSVFGVDADGDYILGAGAPTVSLTSSDGTVVSVGSSTVAAPNRFTVTTVASAPAAAQLVASATPVSASGGSAVSATVYVSSTAPVIMAGNGQTANAIELSADGLIVGLPTSEFINSSNVGPSAITYGPSGTVVEIGVIYAQYPSTGSTVKVFSFNTSGTQTGSSQLTGGMASVSCAVYDSHNQWTYIAGSDSNNNTIVTAVDASGNQQTLSGGFTGLSNPRAIAFDPQNDNLYVAAQGGVLAYNESGVRQSVPVFGSGSTSVAYGAEHSWLYTITGGSGGTTGKMVVYDANGVQQSPSITGLSEPLEITYNPGSGLMYILNGGNNTMTIGTQDGAKLTTVYPTAEAIFAAIP